MDPLSVTASVITVIQTTYEVIGVCQSYNAARQNSTWQLPRVIAELKNVGDVLASLESLARKAESGDPTVGPRLPQLKTLCQLDHGALHLCLTEIQALREKLTPPRWMGKEDLKRVDLYRAMAWPLQESSTKKILEKLQRLRGNISLALNVDMAEIVLSTHDSTKVIQQDLLSVDQNVDDIQRSLQSMAVETLLDKVNNWLIAPDPWAKYKETLKARYPGTGAWLVKDSERFFGWWSQLGSFLWLHGIPGCGKTVLSCTVIESILDHCNVAPLQGFAFYYFDFREDETQGVGNLLRALLKRFSRQLPSASQELQSLYQSAQPEIRQPSIDELLVTLHRMLQHFDDSFIVMDALDECSHREERVKLFDTLAEIEGWDQIRLHTLVTSRPETDIKSAMEDGTVFRQAIPIDSQLVQDDIRSYVLNRLQQDTRLKRWRKNAQRQEEIENVLTEKANGMFQWASCQLDSLGKCLNLPMLRKTLATLPKTLNQTYERILSNIDEEYATYAKRFMKWLAYSARPLSLRELAEIVTVEIGEESRVDALRRLPDPEDVLTICSSLVTVKQTRCIPTCQLINLEDTLKHIFDDDAQEDGSCDFEVALAHFSVKEFLISTDIQTGPVKDYAVTETDASNSIAETCLAYLLYSNTQPKHIYGARRRLPLTLYAAQYWPSHYKDAKAEGGLLMQLAMELLCSRAFFTCVSLHHPISDIFRSSIWKTSEGNFLPLHYACAHGITDLVECLLEMRGKAVHVDGLGDINTMSRFGSALAIASARGYFDTIKVLIEHHANDDLWYQPDGEPLKYKDIKNDGIPRDNRNLVPGSFRPPFSALYVACRERHEAIVRLLLDSNADANLIGGHYGTPLHEAIVTKNERIVRTLLDNDVNLEISVGLYGTALHIASLERCKSIVRLLLERGADVNMLGGRHGSALGAAIARDHFAIVSVLLDAGADFNVSREVYYDEKIDEYVPCQPHLHNAVRSPGSMQRLLEKGARVNARNAAGRTALSAALEADTSLWSFQILLLYGASLSFLDDTDMKRFNKLRPELGLATEADEDRKDD